MAIRRGFERASPDIYMPLRPRCAHESQSISEGSFQRSNRPVRLASAIWCHQRTKRASGLPNREVRTGLGAPR